ncbi:MAG: hypothetical protein Kow0027_13440 [Saprospiraceae bacterium]|jgi:transcriptional regulator with XRE-family HTH domain
MKNKLLERALAEVPEETKVFVRKYTDIVDRINYLLKEKGINQKQLAQKMGKRESEISKWLKSGQNLTLKSIAKLEVALGEEIIAVPKPEDLVTRPKAPVKQSKR